ncbi:hypothetical protein CDD83_9371 [Cordyceps sp. RAO-2017]|nr:hypothetical protein CDD83_9371 [Cordyceps sp. RAO-2017]
MKQFSHVLLAATGLGFAATCHGNAADASKQFAADIYIPTSPGDKIFNMTRDLVLNDTQENLYSCIGGAVSKNCTISHRLPSRDNPSYRHRLRGGNIHVDEWLDLRTTVEWNGLKAESVGTE